MNRFQVVHRAEAPADAGPLADRLPGGGEAWRLSPDGYPLWMHEVHLPAGARLEWPDRHGEEAVFVRSGAVRLSDGREAPAGSVLVVEGRSQPTIEAVGTPGGTPGDTGPAVLVAMGTDGGALPSGGPNGTVEAGARTHLVGPRGIAEWARPPAKLTRYYTTASCPGCRLMLMHSASTEPYGSQVHSHTADELIHVLTGSVRVGSTWVEPGDTLAIPADVKYRFQSGGSGYGFINYRPDASYYVAVDGTRHLEAGGGEQFVYTGDGADYVGPDDYEALRRRVGPVVVTSRLPGSDAAATATESETDQEVS
jgi:mannose-6-phosphate isomerase-like protein (cupin superfamily)